MQPSHNSPRKGPKFFDTKVFIAALAVAITVGFWNIFSNNAFQLVVATPTAITLPIQPDTGNGQDFPPLPTLVPLVDVSIPITVDAAPQPQAQISNQVVSLEKSAQPKAKTALRSVTVPTQEIIQKGPIMQQSVDTVSSSTGGGNSGGKTSSATTKSSKKK